MNIKFLFSIVIIFLSVDAFSAGIVTAKVEYLQIGEGNTSSNSYVLVKMNADPTGQPGCASDDQHRFALDPATDLGKTLYSALLSAKHAKAAVEVRGTGDCGIMGYGYESISLIRLR